MNVSLRTHWFAMGSIIITILFAGQGCRNNQKASDSASTAKITIGFDSSSALNSISNTGSYVIPGSLGDFDCFAINVLANDIGTAPSCGGDSQIGVAAGFVSGGSVLELDVPMGSNRTFQVWGFASSASCPNIIDLLTTPKGSLPAGARSTGFLLAQRSVDVFQRNMSVEMNLSFNLNASPTVCGSLPYPRAQIQYARLHPGVEPLPGLATSDATSDSSGLCIGYASSAKSPLYKCFEDGSQVPCNASGCKTNPDGLYHRISPALAASEGTHHFRIETTDTVYGLNDPSPPRFEWTLDTTAPVMAIQGISPGKFSGGTYYTTSTAPALKLLTNEAGKAFMRWSGPSFSNCAALAAPGIFNCTVSPALPVPGPTSVDLYVTDKADNASSTQTIQIAIDTTPPSIALTPAAVTGNSIWLMGGDLTSAYSVANPDAVIPIATDAAGGAIDPSTFACDTDSTSALCPYPLGTGTISFASKPIGGLHSLTVNVKDFAGNAAAPASASVFIDSASGLVTLGRLKPPAAYALPSYATDETSSAANSPNQPLAVGLNNPGQIALDIAGSRLFVADSQNNRVLIYRWNAARHTVTNYAAIDVIGQPDFLLLDASPAVPADLPSFSSFYTPFKNPRGAAYDPVHKALFVSDTGNHRVLRFNAGLTVGTSNPGGISKTADIVFGQSSKNGAGFNQNNFTASAGGQTTNGLYSPQGLYFHPNHKLYVADSGNCRIAVFANADTTSTNGDALAAHIGASGASPGGSWACDPAGPTLPATAANSMGFPGALTFDLVADALYVADTGFNRILKFSPGSTATTASSAVDWIGQDAADPTANASGDGAGGVASGNPSLDSPAGIAAIQTESGSKLLAVSAGNNHNKIKFFDPAARGVSAIWNTSEATGTINGTIGPSPSTLNSPAQLFFDPTSSTLFVSDSGNNRIGFFSSSVISDDAQMRDALGHADIFGVFASLTAAAANSPNDSNLNAPTDVVADVSRLRLYVSDTGNNRVLVYKLDPTTYRPASPKAIAVLGVPLLSTKSNPMLDSVAAPLAYPPAPNTLSQPKGLALDAVGRLYVADTGNNRVVRFPTNTAVVSSSLSADLLLGQAIFSANAAGVMSAPTGVAYDVNSDRLLVTDTNHDRVLAYSPLAALPSGTTAPTESMSSMGTPATGLSAPTKIAFINGSTGSLPTGLLIADTGYNRIVYIDLSAGAPSYALPGSLAGGPTGCFGHHAVSSCSSGAANDGGTLATNGNYALSAPAGFFFDPVRKHLHVSDTGNNRVVAYDLNVAANTPANAAFSASHIAFHAMGAQDLYSANYDPSTGASHSGLNSPAGIFRLAPPNGVNLIYIADPSWHRVGMYEVP